MNHQPPVYEVIALATLFVLGVTGLFMLLLKLGPEESHSFAWHRMNGKFRVRYEDGQYSQPFSRKVANDYAEMFGGVVVPKGEYAPS